MTTKKYFFQFEKLELEETVLEKPGNPATALELSGNPVRDTKPEPELLKEEKKPQQSSRSSKRQEVDPDDDVINTLLGQKSHYTSE